MEDQRAEEAWYEAHRNEIDQFRNSGNCTMQMPENKRKQEQDFQTSINNDVDGIIKFHDYNCRSQLINEQRFLDFYDLKGHDNFDFLLGIICGLLISNQRSDEK